jgi:hypothetical protein
MAKHPELVEGAILSLLEKAADGDIKHIREMFDRAQGKPAQTQTIKHEGIGKIVQLEDEDDGKEGT